MVGHNRGLSYPFSGVSAPNFASNFQADFGRRGLLELANELDGSPAARLGALLPRRTPVSRGVSQRGAAEPPAADSVRPAANSGPRGWQLSPSEGAYAGVVAWQSRSSWFDALLDVLATDEGERARAAARISPDTFLRVAWADALSADSGTGRGVATSHQSVATRLGMSTKTVQRCRNLLEQLGFAVEIVRGRHLTGAERKAARETHGRFQDRAASLRALTMPRPAEAVENVHPPRRGSVKRSSGVSEVLKHQRARAHAGEDPPLTTRSSTLRPRGRTLGRNYTPWPRDQFDFAADFKSRIPALRRFHTATICKLLHSSGIQASRWTVDALLHSLDVSATERGGLVFATSDRMRSPLGYVAAVLRNSINEVEETPVEAIRRERAERAAVRTAAAAKTPAGAPASPHRTREAPQHLPGAEIQVLTVRRLTVHKLYELDHPTQLLVGTATAIARKLNDRGWELTTDAGLGFRKGRLRAELALNTSTSLPRLELAITIDDGPRRTMILDTPITSPHE
ncbi:MAG: hypothetical protein QM598_05900 [Protaetiibacter sp.]